MTSTRCSQEHYPLDAVVATILRKRRIMDLRNKPARGPSVKRITPTALTATDTTVLALLDQRRKATFSEIVESHYRTSATEKQLTHLAKLVMRLVAQDRLELDGTTFRTIGAE